MPTSGAAAEDPEIGLPAESRKGSAVYPGAAAAPEPPSLASARSGEVTQREATETTSMKRTGPPAGSIGEVARLKVTMAAAAEKTDQLRVLLGGPRWNRVRDDVQRVQRRAPPSFGAARLGTGVEPAEVPGRPREARDMAAAPASMPLAPPSQRTSLLTRVAGLEGEHASLSAAAAEARRGLETAEQAAEREAAAHDSRITSLEERMEVVWKMLDDALLEKSRQARRIADLEQSLAGAPDDV